MKSRKGKCRRRSCREHVQNENFARATDGRRMMLQVYVETLPAKSCATATLPLLLW